MSKRQRGALISACVIMTLGGLATGANVWALDLTLTEVVSGVSQVTHITHAGDGSNRLFVVRQAGTIELVKQDTLGETPFLDIGDRISAGGERGLLSVAFPPNFSQTRHFYVYYTDPRSNSVISRFRVGGNPDRADAGSEEVILTFSQPFANHNGGQLAFGPDGYLYVASGDGGSAGDPQDNAQDLATLLGKLLRIDVESGTGSYRVPPSNPFVNQGNARAEIWAYGLRNPWRFSFDRRSGDLYIADVGQSGREEINFAPVGDSGGQNYGWNRMEGSTCFGDDNCDKSGFTLPVAEYDHDLGCSITGGYVYRGSLYPAMAGTYFYGDFCSGRIWGLTHSGGGWKTRELAQTDFAISTFGEDEAGNLYMADFGGGIYRLSDGGPQPLKPAITAAFSGSWYNPDEDGQGFLLEVLPDQRLAAYWFTYDLADGQQLWIVGQGSILGDSAVVDAIVTRGGIFGPLFDPAAVERLPWGTLTLSFENCSQGSVAYAAGNGFGSGRVQIERLTTPAGLECRQ